MQISLKQDLLTDKQNVIGYEDFREYHSKAVKKVIFLLSKLALNILKVTVKILLMLQIISVSIIPVLFYSTKVLKTVTDFNIDKNKKYFLSSKSSY